MGLIDILPVSMRAALLYAKSAKIAKSDKTAREKLEMIRKKKRTSGRGNPVSILKRLEKNKLLPSPLDLKI